LVTLLDKMKAGEAQVIFSNAFPAGTLPLPMGVRDTLADFETIESKEERRRAYQNHKKIKAAKFVTREWFEKICRGEGAGFTKGLVADEAKEQTIIHNVVSRDSGCVQKSEAEQGGSLFEEDEFFAEAGTRYDVYVESALPEEVLRKTVELMLMLGIGKNKSTGKGAFELLEWYPEEALQIENANAFVSLSNFVPAKEDPTEGQYKTMIKFGKLDREYASGEIPFKKPLMFLQAGSVFFSSQNKAYYGRCVQDVSAVDGVVVNGYAMVVPMKLPKEQA